MIEVYKILENIFNYVKKLAYGVETISKVKRFSNDQQLNLKNEGSGIGVRNFTLRNLGKSIILISTGTNDEKEPINPDESFAISSPHRVCDDQIKIIFSTIHPDFATDATRSTNDAIVRFLVDKC